MKSYEFNQTIKVALQLLSKRQKFTILIITFIQLFMSFLDLLGIAIFGFIVSLSLYGIQSKNSPNYIQEILNSIGLGNISFQSQVAILGISAGILLVFKTFFTAYFSKKILFFLNLRTAHISAKLLEKILKQPYDFIKRETPSSFLYSLTGGVQSIIVISLGSLGIIFNECILLVFVATGIFIFDPVMSILILLFFGSFAFLQSRILNKVAQKSQAKSVEKSILIEKRILESLFLFREMHVRGARNLEIQDLTDAKIDMANFNSKVAFLPYIAKYSMEILLVVGAFLMAAAQFLMKDAIPALTSLAVFLVATSRISPSILRLQGAMIQLRVGIGGSKATIDLISQLGSATYVSSSNELKKSQFGLDDSPSGKIVISSLTFRYKDSESDAVRDINLEILPGKMVAIIGPSGNGKSTLLDLIMGALHPTEGSIHIDDLAPETFVHLYPGALSFVAQESVFASSSIKYNLLMGLKPDLYSEEKIWNAIDKVGLKEYVENLPEGLDAQVGERGMKLSVGQRQRLSLARAILTDPKILLLDEPTSSLDSDSENYISNLINSLKGRMTIVVIAHRLKTIREADQVIVIKEGKVVQTGEPTVVLDEELS